MSVASPLMECTAVAVIGTHSPARSLAMARVLDDCVQRHGWSGRVTVAAAGFGSGAGLGKETRQRYLRGRFSLRPR